MKIPGMSKSPGIGGERLKGWDFDIKTCREALGIQGCLIELEEEEGDDSV